jgi:hypothetical protein
LGYEAHDTDDSINDWHDRQTGEVVSFKPESPEQTTKWVETHDFLMSERKVADLAIKAKDQDMFICGHASNDVDLMSYFKKVFCLLLDENETRNRLLSRKNNTWGNDPEQLNLLMKWYAPTIERYRRVRAMMIDASQPVNVIVDELLELTND